MERSAVAEPALAVRNESSGSAEVLRRLAAQRSREAWAELLERHGEEILRVCARVLRDEVLAEDACQETLLQIRACAGGFREPAGDADRAARAWILRVAYRVALNMLRSRRRSAKRDEAAAREESPGAGTESGDEMARVLGALEQLPAKVRRPLELHYLGGMDYGQMGSALRCSAEAAKMRVHRGLERLRERLAYSGAIVALGGLDEMLRDAFTAQPRPQGLTGAARMEQWMRLLEAPRNPPPIVEASEGGWSLMTKAMLGFAGVVGLTLLASAKLPSAEPAPKPLETAAPAPVPGQRDALDEAMADLQSNIVQRRTVAEAALLKACPGALPRLKAASAAAGVDAKARIDAVRRRFYAEHPEHAFRLRVELPNRLFTLGVDYFFDARVKIENVSDMELGILKHNALLNLMDVWTSSVRNGSGQVEPDNRKLKVFINEPVPFSRASYEILRPSDTAETTTQVHLDPNLAPGAYTATVRYHFAGKAVVDDSARALNEVCLHCTVKSLPMAFTLRR